MASGWRRHDRTIEDLLNDPPSGPSVAQPVAGAPDADAIRYADFRTQWSTAQAQLPAVVHYVEHVENSRREAVAWGQRMRERSVRVAVWCSLGWAATAVAVAVVLTKRP